MLLHPLPPAFGKGVESRAWVSQLASWCCLILSSMPAFFTSFLCFCRDKYSLSVLLCRGLAKHATGGEFIGIPQVAIFQMETGSYLHGTTLFTAVGLISSLLKSLFSGAQLELVLNLLCLQHQGSVRGSLPTAFFPGCLCQLQGPCEAVRCLSVADSLFHIFI